MQALWLLPSLSMSLLWGFRSGQWLMACLTAAVALLPLIVRQRRVNQNATPAVEFVRNRVVLNGKRLPSNSRLWLPHWNAAVAAAIRSRSTNSITEKLLQEARERGFAASRSGQLSLWLGISATGDLMIDLFDLGPHIFVVGPTGTGKSQFLKLLVQSLSKSYHRSEVAIAVIDFKGSALVREINPSNLVRVVDDLQPDSIEPFLNWLGEQVALRESRANVASRHLVVIVDEAAALFREHLKSASVLSNIAARGRSLGIVLVIANQGMSGIARELLLNLKLRVALAGTDTVELVQLGGAANKLTRDHANLFRARLISQSMNDIDFHFPGLTSQAPIQG